VGGEGWLRRRLASGFLSRIVFVINWQLHNNISFIFLNGSSAQQHNYFLVSFGVDVSFSLSRTPPSTPREARPNQTFY
jgi:hypothetical protein